MTSIKEMQRGPHYGLGVTLVDRLLCSLCAVCRKMRIWSDSNWWAVFAGARHQNLVQPGAMDV